MTIRGAEGAGLARDLGALLGADAVLSGATARPYETDATATRGVRGRADAVALPDSSAAVAAVVAWCYAHDVAIVPRGGGSGLAGGAVPDGGLVLSLERMAGVRALEPQLWRMHVEAGLRTAHVHRLARENGLLFPPDPAAAEQSQIGGNIATNAGGPHAFKYGATGAWVTGVEAVLAPGELVVSGGPLRKDVSGYDLTHLLVGSEGTLGVITAAWLRLTPTPEAAIPVVAVHRDAATGCRAMLDVLASGLQPAALDYLDAEALSLARHGWVVDVPSGFMVIAEADGTRAQAEALATELVEVLGAGARWTHVADDAPAARALWRWRDAVSPAVTAARGGKLSEDVSVPPERVAEAVEETLGIGARYGLQACSWGHAGDGNLHCTFLVDPGSEDELARARSAAQEVFAMALRLGGAVSGEHGIGLVKSGWAAHGCGPAGGAAGQVVDERIKALLDPKGLLNPGKKVARPPV